MFEFLEKRKKEKKKKMELDNATVEIIGYLSPYSPELNIIETLWRFMKYVWINYLAYLSWNNLLLSIQKIFDRYGQKFRIDFS